MSAHLEARAEESPEQSLSHKKTTELIASSARAFDVQVGTADMQNWSAAFTMAKALDTLVDEDHLYNSGDYAERLLAGEQIPYITPEQGSFIQEAYTGLSPESQDRWQNAARQLGAFAIKRLEAADIQEYITVVSDESQLMADVLAVENNPARTDSLPRDFFNGWLSQMARTAYLADTLSDFVRDYNEGNTIIKPSLASAATLALHTAKEGLEFARITPLPVYTAIARRAITKSFEKLQRPNFIREQFVRKERGY